MNGLFGIYIEKGMHLVTIKNMLLLAVGSLIITDLGLYVLMLIFPKSPFFKTFIWEVIGPVELEALPIIGYILGIVAFVLVTSGILYGIFKIFKGQVIAAPIYLFLDLRISGGSGGLSTMELVNVFIMAQLMSKQFGLSPWITGISFYIVSFIFGVGGIMLSMTV